MAPPDYGHPGQYGAAFYYERLQWQNTVEATKPLPGAAPFWPVPGYSLLDAAGADVGPFGHPLNLSFVDHLPIQKRIVNVHLEVPAKKRYDFELCWVPLGCE